MPRFKLHPADADEYDQSEETATLERAAIDPLLCVVRGLTSESGAQLNGRMGKADLASQAELDEVGPEDRVPVRLLDNDNQTLLPPKAIKKKNLRFASVARDTTGAGICVVTSNPFGPSNLAFSRWSSDAGPSVSGISRLNLEHMPFETLDDLPVPLQFLLACGPSPDLAKAQEALQRMADGNCRALPMAMRRGDAALVLPSGAAEAAADASGEEAEEGRASKGQAPNGDEAEAQHGLEEEEEEYDSTVEYDDDDDEEVIFTPPPPEGSDEATEGEAGAGAPHAASASSSAVAAAASAPATALSEAAEMRVPECTVIPGTLLSLSAASGLARLRVPGAGLTCLEWAAKRGNLEIVRWLCTDERTKGLLQQGSPVGWACYGGHVEVARYLVRSGGDPRATDAILWKGLPPFLAAAEAGQVRTLEYLVSEERISIHTTDEQGLGILYKVQQVPDYKLHPGLVAVEEWALAHGAKKQYIKWK